MKKFILLVIALFIYSSASAANLYLDASGSGCNNGDTNYDVATRTCGAGAETVYIDVRTASNNLGSGDHLYIRAGEYYYNTDLGYWTNCILVIDGTGTIVENYNSEVVWLETGTDHTGDMLATEYNNPVDISGTNCQLKGNGYNFFIWGAVLLSGTTNTISGMDFSGGSDKQDVYPSGRWGNFIRITGGSGHTIKDNKFHDNQAGSTASANKSMIIHGFGAGSGATGVIVENNHFYNCVADAVYDKYQSTSGTIDATYRYNFFDNCGTINAANSSQGKQLLIYQNVFVDARGSAWDSTGTTLGRLVYNNTFYISSASTFMSGSWGNSTLSEWSVFNNIYYYTGSSTGTAQEHQDASGGSITGYFDYNDYYQAGSGPVRFTWSGNTNNTLANWITASGGEGNSITTDPGFNPDDASLDGDDPTDFKRTAYTTNGRGGAYPSVMGAYITGSETIGLLNGGGIPSLSSITVGTNGTTVTIVASEAITQGSGYNDSDLDIDCSTTGDNITLTYVSGDGTATHIYTAGSTIQAAETCNFDFNGDTDSLENSSSNDLPAITSQSVTNSSTQGASSNTSHAATYNAAGKTGVYNANGYQMVAP